jgi:hypothetical protein
MVGEPCSGVICSSVIRATSRPPSGPKQVWLILAAESSFTLGREALVSQQGESVRPAHTRLTVLRRLTVRYYGSKYLTLKYPPNGGADSQQWDSVRLYGCKTSSCVRQCQCQCSVRSWPRPVPSPSSTRSPRMASCLLCVRSGGSPATSGRSGPPARTACRRRGLGSRRPSGAPRSSPSVASSSTRCYPTPPPSTLCARSASRNMSGGAQQRAYIGWMRPCADYR